MMPIPRVVGHEEVRQVVLIVIHLLVRCSGGKHQRPTASFSFFLWGLHCTWGNPHINPISRLLVQRKKTFLRRMHVPHSLTHSLSLSHTHTLSLSLSIYLSVFGPFTPVHTRPSHRYRRRDPHGGHDCHRHCTMEPSAPGSISGKLSAAKPSAGSVSC